MSPFFKYFDVEIVIVSSISFWKLVWKNKNRNPHTLSYHIHIKNANKRNEFYLIGLSFDVSAFELFLYL